MNLPTIPEAEFQQRQVRVQEMMKQAGVDLLIAYADDRAVFGQAHARWLLDYHPHFEPACMLIPAEGEVVMLTGAESEDFVYETSYCRNVKIVQEFTHPDEEYPYTTITSIGKVLGTFRQSLNREIKHVGIAGLDLMPHRLYRAFEDIFGKDQMRDMEYEMLQLRKVKSANEIKVIEYAYHLAQQGMEEALAVIAEGRTEREVAAAVEYKMRLLGSEGMGIDTIVAAGTEHTYPVLARTTHRKIREGDLIVLTIAPRYEGYHGAIARSFVLGQSDPRIESALKTAVEAQQAAKALLMPGVTGREVDEAARRVVKEAGLGKHFVYSGIHSVGVIEFEPPILSSTQQGKIEENMVLSIDIPLFLNEWGGVRIEDGYHITAAGARPLQEMSSFVNRL